MPVAGVATIVLGLVAAFAVASCVTVIAVQLWQTSAALADVDASVAAVPYALAGMEPAMDIINESLADIAEAAIDPAPARA